MLFTHSSSTATVLIHNIHISGRALKLFSIQKTLSVIHFRWWRFVSATIHNFTAGSHPDLISLQSRPRVQKWTALRGICVNHINFDGPKIYSVYKLQTYIHKQIQTQEIIPQCIFFICIWVNVNSGNKTLIMWSASYHKKTLTSAKHCPSTLSVITKHQWRKQKVHLSALLCHPVCTVV